MRLLGTSLLLGALSVLAPCQAKMTLEDALVSARSNNGTVLAAQLDFEAAKASTRADYSSYLPTVTPNFSQENGRTNTYTGPNRGHDTFDTTDASVTARWLLFDNGERAASYARSRAQRDQAMYSTLDTLRAILVDVHTSFFDALRSQELLKVANSSLERALKLQDATEKREQFGSGPKKDILQARADALNAKVNVLTSQNQVSTTAATLKAVIGWPDETLPPLDDSQSSIPNVATYTLEEAFANGLKNRPSLLAARKRIEGSRFSVSLARLNSGVSFQGVANYNRSFSESVFDRTFFQLTASVPLYDGSRSSESVRAAELAYSADKASLTQSERDVKADIEAAYKSFKQNFDRLEASRLAREAAQLNFKAAEGAYREGAGTVLDQLTAQVSLATAESNYVQSYYDLLISDVRLKQVVGDPIPGEPSYK